MIAYWHSANNYTIIITVTTKFIVLSSWQDHCKSSLGSFDECRQKQNKTTPFQSPLTTLGQETGWAYSTTLLSPHGARISEWRTDVPCRGIRVELIQSVSDQLSDDGRRVISTVDEYQPCLFIIHAGVTIATLHQSTGRVHQRPRTAHCKHHTVTGCNMGNLHISNPLLRTHSPLRQQRKINQISVKKVINIYYIYNQHLKVTCH